MFDNTMLNSHVTLLQMFLSQHMFLGNFIKKLKIVIKLCNTMMMMMLQGYKVILFSSRMYPSTFWI